MSQSHLVVFLRDETLFASSWFNGLLFVRVFMPLFFYFFFFSLFLMTPSHPRHDFSFEHRSTSCTYTRSMYPVFPLVLSSRNSPS